MSRWILYTSLLLTTTPGVSSALPGVSSALPGVSSALPGVSSAFEYGGVRLVLHAETPTDSATAITCDWEHRPNTTVEAGWSGAVYLIAYGYFYGEYDLATVQTAFDWDDWTLTSGSWANLPGQMTTRTPTGPGATNGTLLATFDPVVGGEALVLGYMNMTATAGSLRQVDSSYPGGTHVGSSGGKTDTVLVGNRGLIRVDGPGIDSCGGSCSQPVQADCTSALYPESEVHYLGNVDGGPALDDLDGDGRLDLVTTIDGYLTIMLGVGYGSFGEPVFIPSDYRSAALGDLDGDQIVDIAANKGDAIVVLLGTGNGTFGVPTSYPAGGASGRPELVDVNGDGALDGLALVRVDVSTRMAILLGGDDGSFGPPALVDIGPNPLNFVVGDVNVDESPDVVVLNDTPGDNDIRILIGNGDGTFESSNFTVSAPNPKGALALGDLDGDLIPDLVVCEILTCPSQICGDYGNVHLGLGDGTFAYHGQYDTLRCAARAALHDMDGDQNLDLIVLRSDWSRCTSHAFVCGGEIAVFAGNGDGSFGRYSSIHSCPLGTERCSGFAIGDLDRDETPDLVVGSMGSIAVYRSKKGTPVHLAWFTVDASNGVVTVRWRTSFETDHAGFHVYRARSGIDRHERMNDELIRSPTYGLFDYSFIDHAVVAGETYAYRLEAVDIFGDTQTFDVGTATVGPAAPTRLVLYQNEPNPFNPSTRIAFDLPYPTPVTLGIYDAAGRHVRTLVDSRKEPDSHSVLWDGLDERGIRSGSGVYFYRLHAGDRTLTRRLVMLK